MLTSQGVLLATAMAVSAGTIILFDLFRVKYFSLPQNPFKQDSISHQHLLLKSCLSSSGKKRREKKKKKRKKETKKKRVKFAEDVINESNSRINGRRILCKREDTKSGELIQNVFSGKLEIVEMNKMPANRVALYNAILKDRVQRMEYSY